MIFELEHFAVDDGISMNELRNSDAEVVYVTPSHQFPYGMIMPISRRVDLLKWAEERDRYVRLSPVNYCFILRSSIHSHQTYIHHIICDRIQDKNIYRIYQLIFL